MTVRNSIFNYLLILIFSSITFSQQKYPDFEIFTHVIGSNPSEDSVRFWAETDDAVWDCDHSASIENQFLIDSYNYAFSTYSQPPPYSTAVPIPDTSNS